MSGHLGTITLLVALLAGCGGDTDPGPGGGGSTDDDAGARAELSNVTVAVSYEGDREGALVVGAFLSDPPTGPPRAYREVVAPEFPQTVELRDLEPDTYYITAILDSEPASRTLPGPEDLTVTSDPLPVDGEPSHSVSLTLTDP